MESRHCATLTIELVQTGPSLISKFEEMATYLASDFLFLCRHLWECQNEAWPSLNQLNGGCGTPPNFPLVPLAFEYLALTQVYRPTFFWWRL